MAEFLAVLVLCLGLFAVWYGARGAMARRRAVARMSRHRDEIEEERLELEAEMEEGRVASVLERRAWPLWVLGLGAFAIGHLVFDLTPIVSFALGVFGGVVGWRLEERRVDRLALKLESQLADAVDLIVSSVRSGGTIVDAIGQAAERTDGIVGDELTEVVERLRIGQSARDVLAELRARIPLDSFRLFTFTIGTNWEGGAGHAHALSSVGRAIRDRVALRRRLRTQTVETEVSVIGVLALTYGLAYLVAHSSSIDFAQFASSSMGQFVITAILLMQAVGVLWVQRLARIHV